MARTQRPALPASRGGGWLALFSPIFLLVLRRIDARLQHGRVDTVLPGGERRILGGRAPGPVASIELHSWRALLRLKSSGTIGWYEGWAKGEWSSPDLATLFDLLIRNRRTLGDSARARGPGRVLRRLVHRRQRNSRDGAPRNIHAHYDLGNDFYAAWLDPGMSYSSALFAEPVSDAEPLASAQHRKLAAMLARTNTAPGDDILEIGCGWGSFVAHAAHAGRSIHAITLSAAQRQSVEGLIARQALSGARVSQCDYRDVTGRYDAVVSIEMVEAVGQEYWGAYLQVIATALRPGGRAAIQYISIDDAIFDGYARNVDFIQAYVFPGGMLLSERHFRAAAEAAGLEWHDQHRFGAHYAETLRRWRGSFELAVAEQRLPATFSDDQIALWRYYLAYCEGGFRGGGIDVSQVTLVKHG